MRTFHDTESRQINILDERFYQFEKGVYFPSVTTVLEAYPKGYGFTNWLKQVGFNADHIVREAADVGSKIHNTIEAHLKGEDVHWMSEDGSANFTLQEWKMLMGYREFMQLYKPKVLGVEVELVSELYEVGGTIDLPCEINGERWIIDHKTSNAIHKTHELQLCAYAKMWNEAYPQQKIDRVGVLWLKALTRGPDRTGKKIQGEGWQVVEFSRKNKTGKTVTGKEAIELGFKLYQHTRAIWDEENPDYKPKNLIYPDHL